MGYRNDQFFRLPSGEGQSTVIGERGRRSTFHWIDADNPSFKYPDRTVRTYKKTADDRIISEETLLKRGFIRSLSLGANDPVRKCQFQFNPQTLTQSVSFSEGSVLNFFQQDPGQFAQPMAGNFDMSFTLMFDRTFEINNGFQTLYDVDERRIRPGNDTVGDPDDPWGTGSPSQVGVLRDIAALYQVIGQGVTERTYDYQLASYESTIAIESLSNDDDVDAQEALNNVTGFLEQNLGNYAFLTPLPVRVVFSSLYMLEGYVTGCSVTFQKFNTAYVPTQAMVGLTMRVLSAGAAKKDTFLTYSLEQARIAQVEEQKEAVAERRDTWRIYQDELREWDVQVVYGGGVTASPNVLGQGGQDFQVVVTQPNKLDKLTELFQQDGLSVRVFGTLRGYYDIPNLPVPVGKEDSPADALFSFNSGWVTKAGDLGRIRLVEGVTRKYGPNPFGTIPSGGGFTRFVYNIVVELKYRGAYQVGKAQKVVDFQNEALRYGASRLDERLPVRFDWLGDPTDLPPLAPSTDSVVEPGNVSIRGFVL